MFNIIINLRDLIKKFCILVVIIILIFVLYKNLNKIFYFINLECEKILESEISYSNYEEISFEKGVKKILGSELLILQRNELTDLEISNENNSYNLESVEKLDNSEELQITDIIVEEKNENSNDIEEKMEKNEENLVDYKNLKTQIISEKNLKESYNAEYKGVKIKNESNYTLTEDILNPNIEYKNKKDILIFHTHTCESYTQTNENKYKESGNYRCTDLNYTVARVGEELTQNLVNKGFNVIHDTTYHDYPAYTGSYNRSLLTVKNILEKNPNIQTVIDLHRDAISSKSDYGPTVKIEDEKVAQLMFVIGTNGGGLNHPNWKNNLKYAVKIEQKANEMFPGLFRPIIVRNSRYNQNLADSACIIEVGATGNTLEECIGSMKYLAVVLAEVMK